MHRIIDIPVALCTPERFAPFGQVMALPAGQSQHMWSTTRTWSADFSVDGETELMFARADPIPMQFTKMERHFSVTQTFIPLANATVAMVFAAPTGDDNDAAPDPASFRGLLIPGDMAVMMYRGVWHSSRFLTRGTPGDFIILTDARATAELQSDAALGRGRLSHVAHYDKSHDLSFRLSDPEGLFARA